ncbi:hypothetical protein AMTR_s00143p00103940 [Amborella trichopoda]|uniref:Uncharacterized protein n=1 Tax=Amborella trichopoda TaxID=13333 RepID=W1PEE3_AMBTC|nr:hypothetical protein AMTR_s00143p00103940 [Amborella trichopoda]
MRGQERTSWVALSAHRAKDCPQKQPLSTVQTMEEGEEEAIRAPSLQLHEIQKVGKENPQEVGPQTDKGYEQDAAQSIVGIARDILLKAGLPQRQATYLTTILLEEAKEGLMAPTTIERLLKEYTDVKPPQLAKSLPLLRVVDHQ